MDLHYCVPQQTHPRRAWVEAATLVTLGIILTLVLALQLPSTGFAARLPGNGAAVQPNSNQISPRAIPVPTPPAAHADHPMRPHLAATPLPSPAFQQQLAHPQPRPVQTPPPGQ